MDPSQSFDGMMARLKAGDDSAATHVFQRFAQRLIALARSRLEKSLRRKVDPEDILQSVFRSFFMRHAAGQFDVSGWDSLWSMLTVITLRKCANQARYFHRARRNVKQEAAAETEGSESAGDMESLSREPTPEEAAMLTELVEEMMRKFEERDRDIFALSLQGQTVREISEQIGYAERTVRRTREHIFHHLQDLREQPARIE